ncbi:RlpA-like double-psi beta-barrel-protein domain-containing protein-containing protein [Umbelopsis sp. AD052]|nr:RlpA-like double-psi beta-barrel-protein domain-containing protein-containing protein [Umbelopsis sp. AD052]
MKASLLALALAFLATSVTAETCSSVYGQCGGKGWKGPTCCASGSSCIAQSGNVYYSQCLPKSNGNKDAAKTTTKHKTTTTKKATHKASTTKKTTKKAATTKKHTTTSKKAVTSKKTTTSSKKATATSASGTGTTTRYWDCCKASCSWSGKGSVTAPVNSCAANGVSVLSPDVASGCNGGSAYMCNDQQPWAVNDNLAYGFAAATIAGLTEQDWCCTCYALKFTSTSIAGKTLVVQVTNTGGDLGSNQFDLQLPGGGVGIFNGCQSQWNAPSQGWGAQYGGVSSLSACSSLPSALQPGCKFRFGWFEGADNPSVSFEQVVCPAELVAKTGCARK